MKSLFPRLLLLSCVLLGGVRVLPADDLPKPEHLGATVEFTLPPAAAVADNTFTSLWNGGGKTFVIWRDSKLHPWIAEIPDGGAATSVLLDPAGSDNPKTDYYAQSREPQYCYSIGLDKKGFIHVAGDMHGYPGSNDHFMPGRYKRRIVMYWKSKSPYTVSEGFTFVGGDAEKAMPGAKWTYGSFFADNDGELYFTAHVAAIGGKKHVPAEGGIGLYRYNVDKENWTALGAEPPHLYPDAEYYPVLLWDFPGASVISKECHGTIRFDSKNRLHFAAPASTGPEVVGLNALVYACSEDGGKTWKKANGTPIAGLPFRASGPNQADVVASYNFNGLLTRIYNGKDFSGTPAKVCLSPGVDLSMLTAAGSVHWTGELVAREAGEITLELTTNGDSFLNLIKLQKGIMDFSTSMKNGDSWKMVLEKDQTIGLDLEWHRTHASGATSLYWTTPGHRKERIPQQFLLPGHTRFDLFASVCADKDGSPAIACSPSNSLESGWRYWDAAAKKWSNDNPFPGVSRTFNKIYLGADNGLVFESNSGVMHYSTKDYQYVVDPTIMTRAEGYDRPMKRFQIDYTSIFGADEYTYRKTGVYRAVAFDEKQQLWCVVKLAFPPLR